MIAVCSQAASRLGSALGTQRAAMIAACSQAASRLGSALGRQRTAIVNRGVGTFLSFIGGGISRAAGSAIAIGAFFLLFGILPWFGPGVSIFLTVVGLALIAGSLWFNFWSQREAAIDELAEDLSWAIHDLLNRDPRPSTDAEMQKWQEDFDDWCARVNRKLENRAFFTRADQLHFDRLGFITPIRMTGKLSFDFLLSILRLKFERLRDLINWAQQRRR
jgi:hypothetical protein